jgi:hypothetical protein
MSAMSRSAMMGNRINDLARFLPPANRVNFVCRDPQPSEWVVEHGDETAMAPPPLVANAGPNVKAVSKAYAGSQGSQADGSVRRSYSEKGI